MKEYVRVVLVPDIDEEEQAYNHDRPISALVMHQVRHLHAAEQLLPPKRRTGININSLHTELEASNYIQQVTKKLHPQGAKESAAKAQVRPARKQTPGKEKDIKEKPRASSVVHTMPAPGSTRVGPTKRAAGEGRSTGSR